MDARTIHTASFASVCFSVNYCSLVWFSSGSTGKLDCQLNESIRILSGVFELTPKEWLLVLSDIIPPDIR